MANPLVDQGQLNRIKASVVWTSFPALNVTSPYLGKEGIKLALEGNASEYYGTMTGAVPSPAPYQIITLTMALIKSQPLADLYKQQFESNVIMGMATIRPDVVAGLGIYTINNAVLESVREMSFAGEEPTYMVTAKGYYLVNNVLFNT